MMRFQNKEREKLKMAKQINSRERVVEHGEVFTAEREVNAMLALVKTETERIESRFLEPACGTGNFLTEILRRKLTVAMTHSGQNPEEYSKYAILAIASVYGIDILEDNVLKCRRRLLDIWHDFYKTMYKTNCPPKYVKAVRFILKKNILWGDTLTFKMADSEDQFIVFSEWSLVDGEKMKRKEFEFRHLTQYAPPKEKTLFSSIPSAFMPTPLWEYPAVPLFEIVQ